MPLVLLAIAGYLYWKYQHPSGNNPAAVSSNPTVSGTAASNYWTDPLPLTTTARVTNAPLAQQQQRQIPQQQQTTQRQQSQQQNGSFMSFVTSHSAAGVPTFTQGNVSGTPGVFNPAFNAGQQTTQPEMAMPDMSHYLQDPTLQQITYTGRSAPDAAPDPVMSAQQLAYLQNCTYITGAPIQPPPPGC